MSEADKITAELMALADAYATECAFHNEAEADVAKAALEQAIRRAGLGTFIDGFAACKSSGGRGEKIKPSQKSMRELLSEAALGDSRPAVDLEDLWRRLPAASTALLDRKALAMKFARLALLALPQRAEPASVQAAEALRAGVEALEHGRGYPSYDRALASIEAAIARLNAVQPASIALQELRDEWSRARAVDGTKHHECMHMVQVGDRMIRALAALAQRQPAPADPQAPSQEAVTIEHLPGTSGDSLEDAMKWAASQEAREYPLTDDEFDRLQAEYDLCGVDGRLRDFAEAVYQAAATKLRGEFHGEDGYPPMPEPAMEEVPYELWGQNSTYPALYTDAQMRSYVDSDRKARPPSLLTPLPIKARRSHARRCL